jgi:uncharacterized membrane protein
MINIPLDADAECIDGQAGDTTHIVVNPTTQQVTYFVVREQAEDRIERLVPIERVVATTAKVIVLDCTVAEFSEMEPFIETHYLRSEVPDDVEGDPYYLPYRVPVDARLIKVEAEQIPPNQLAVRRGTGIEATDGWVGKVDEFLVNPETGHITHLILREGHLWGTRDLALPISAVDRVFDEVVYLKLDKETVKNLPAVPARRSLGWQEARVELIVLAFDEMGQAEEALEFLKQLRGARSIGPIRNAAVLVVDEDGEASFKETQDVDARHGALFGAITGGLVGLLGGPVGAIVGAAAGAITGRVAAGRIDMGFSNKYLQSVQQKLQPGSSALIAIVEHEWVGQVTEGLTQFKGQLFRQALTDEIVAEIIAESKADDTKST